MENNAIKLIKNYDDFKSNPGGEFYTSFAINLFDKVILEFHGMSTGCGIIQCRGIKKLNNLSDNELAETKEFLINKILEEKYTPRFGMIVATLGPEGRHENYEEYTLKAGFTKITEYNNWYDTSYEKNHIARLYVLKPNLGDKKNI